MKKNEKNNIKVFDFYKNCRYNYVTKKLKKEKKC